MNYSEIHGTPDLEPVLTIEPVSDALSMALHDKEQWLKLLDTADGKREPQGIKTEERDRLLELGS